MDTDQAGGGALPDHEGRHASDAEGAQQQAGEDGEEDGRPPKRARTSPGGGGAIAPTAEAAAADNRQMVLRSDAQPRGDESPVIGVPATSPYRLSFLPLEAVFPKTSRRDPTAAYYNIDLKTANAGPGRYPRCPFNASFPVRYSMVPEEYRALRQEQAVFSHVATLTLPKCINPPTVSAPRAAGPRCARTGRT